METKVFIIDITKCVACYNCFIACKDEFVDHAWLPYSEAQPDLGPAFIEIKEIERGQYPKVKVSYIPHPCMQCQKPPCVKAAKDDAVYQRQDGVVIIDPQKSKGQQQLVKACPYGSIYWNDELGIPQKCTFCVHLLDQKWKMPRCVEVCPTEALKFGTKTELADIITQAEPLHPEYRRDPLVFYIGLPKAFIAGSIYCANSNECLEGAEVYLNRESGQDIVSTITDNYGDFEFEGIEKDRLYSIRIEAQGYYPVTIEGIHSKSGVSLKDIYLKRIVR